MAIFAAIALAASAAVSAFGQHKAGQAANAAAQANAQTFEQNALFTEAEKPIIAENASNERRRLGEMYQAAVGDFRASTASGGIDPNFGSASNVQADAKRAYDIDRRILARNEVSALRAKDIEAYNYRRQGAVTRLEGQAARRAGNLQAFSTLLNAAGTVSQALKKA